MSLLNNWIRVFWDNNGTLEDISLALQDENSNKTLDLDTNKYLYIGQYFPFNNFYIDVSAANTNAVSLNVEYSDGNNGWNAMVDVLDSTNSSGVTLSKTGVIQYEPNKNQRWQMVEDTSSLSANLSQSVVYNLFWVRVSASGATSSVTLNSLDYYFTTNETLQGIDPEIDEYLTQWESGKSNWDEQIRLASHHVISDFKQKKMIRHPGNILRMDDVWFATAYRTLMIIYTKLGKGFEAQLEKAKDNYIKLRDVDLFTFDTNYNGQVEQNEINQSFTTKEMVRR